jgi:hypothetical protein
VPLLATDGLTRHTSDNEILGIVKGAPPSQQAYDALIRRADVRSRDIKRVEGQERELP